MSEEAAVSFFYYYYYYWLQIAAKCIGLASPLFFFGLRAYCLQAV